MGTVMSMAALCCLPTKCQKMDGEGTSDQNRRYHHPWHALECCLVPFVGNELIERNTNRFKPEPDTIVHLLWPEISVSALAMPHNIITRHGNLVSLHLMPWLETLSMKDSSKHQMSEIHSNRDRINVIRHVGSVTHTNPNLWFPVPAIKIPAVRD